MGGGETSQQAQGSGCLQPCHTANPTTRGRGDLRFFLCCCCPSPTWYPRAALQEMAAAAKEDAPGAGEEAGQDGEEGRQEEEGPQGEEGPHGLQADVEQVRIGGDPRESWTSVGRSVLPATQRQLHETALHGALRLIVSAAAFA